MTGHNDWMYELVYNIPDCCHTCPFFSPSVWDYPGELTEPPTCDRSVFFPVKKKSCKVRDAALLVPHQLEANDDHPRTH